MTRIIATALTAVSLSATAAAADNFLPLESQYQDRDSVIELDTVQADGPGVVEIYEYHAGEMGALLGSTPVNAGANANVRIDLGIESETDVIALLKVGGQVVAEQEIEFR